MGELSPWQLDACCKVVCIQIIAGIFSLGLKEYKPLSCYLVFLLNKKVYLQSLRAILREQTGLVKPCLAFAKKNKGWFLLRAQGTGVQSQPLGMTDICLTSNALMHIDLRKLMEDPDSSGPCTWKQLQSYLTV